MNFYIRFTNKLQNQGSVAQRLFKNGFCITSDYIV